MAESIRLFFSKWTFIFKIMSSVQHTLLVILSSRRNEVVVHVSNGQLLEGCHLVIQPQPLNRVTEVYTKSSAPLVPLLYSKYTPQKNIDGNRQRTVSDGIPMLILKFWK